MTKLEDAILDYFNIHKEAHESFVNVERQIDDGELDDVLGHSVGLHHLRQIMWFREKKINKFKDNVNLDDFKKQLNEVAGALDDNLYATNQQSINGWNNDDLRRYLLEVFQDQKEDSQDHNEDSAVEKMVEFAGRGRTGFWLNLAYVYKPTHWSRIFSLEDEVKDVLDSLFHWNECKDCFDLNQEMREWLGISDNEINGNTGGKDSDSASDSDSATLFTRCIPEDYSVEMLSNFIYWYKDRYAAEERERDCKELLEKFKNVVLHGAPGTGKTHMAKELASEMIGCPFEELSSDSHFGFVQFHPSYDYTDFVEGLRPVDDGSGGVKFKLKDGTFKEFCDRAQKDEKAFKKFCDDARENGGEAREPREEEKPYVFVIDEINRGDISKIFGELFFSIDPGYRGEAGSVLTQYSNLHKKEDKGYEKKFYVPENVYVIGTMNDIDRSVDSFDYAMRRRFKFVEVTPVDSQVMLYSKPWYKAAIHRMNQLNTGNKKVSTDNKKVKRGTGSKGVRGIFGARYQIGASYFMELAGSRDEADFNMRLKQLWRQSLRPLLVEYAHDAGVDEEKVDEIGKGITLMEENGDKQGDTSTDDVVGKSVKQMEENGDNQGDISKDDVVEDPQ